MSGTSQHTLVIAEQVCVACKAPATHIVLSMEMPRPIHRTAPRSRRVAAPQLMVPVQCKPYCAACLPEELPPPAPVPVAEDLAPPAWWRAFTVGRVAALMAVLAVFVWCPAWLLRGLLVAGVVIPVVVMARHES